jgi:hypothetical protein
MGIQIDAGGKKAYSFRDIPVFKCQEGFFQVLFFLGLTPNASYNIEAFTCGA